MPESKTPLGARLHELRQKAIDGGMPLLSAEEIEAKVRGCEECDLKRRLEEAEGLLMEAWAYGAIETITKTGRGYSVKRWSCNSSMEDIRDHLTRHGYLSLDGLPTKDHAEIRKRMIEQHKWLESLKGGRA